MNQDEFSSILRRATAAVLENRPSSKELSNRLAARVDKFTHKEFEKAIEGLQELIERLSKTAESLNPQDDARLDIEREISSLMNLKGDVNRSFKELGKIDI